jgi:hypothetical protein
MGDLQVAAKIGPERRLHAMIRPKNLRTVRDLHSLIRLPAGMTGGKRLVAGGMPILGQHHVLESCGQPIDEGHNLVTGGDWQPSAGTEIVLNVDHQENITCGGDGILRHSLFPAW